MSNTLKYITLDQLLSSVKSDLKNINEQGLIDDNTVIKTVMWCNEKLGIPIHKLKQCSIKIENHRGDIPKSFWKLVYTCALSKKKQIYYDYKDPFNNTIDLTKVEECELKPYVEGCQTKCPPKIIKNPGKDIEQIIHEWTELDVANHSAVCCSISPHWKKRGRETVKFDIDEELVSTSFKDGEIFVMYQTNMEDEDGNILVPFHPLLTNWYEWSVKEKILQDIMFNSDADVVNLLKYATQQRGLFWLDALNFAMEPEAGELQKSYQKRENEYYNKYYKYII